MYMIKHLVNIALLLWLSCFMHAGTAVSDQADSILVGEVLSGQQSGSRVAFKLRADRTLKGNMLPWTVIDVEWDRALITRRPQGISGQYGMWFLRANTNGVWQL